MKLWKPAMRANKMTGHTLLGLFTERLSHLFSTQTFPTQTARDRGSARPPAFFSRHCAHVMSSHRVGSVQGVLVNHLNPFRLDTPAHHSSHTPNHTYTPCTQPPRSFQERRRRCREETEETEEAEETQTLPMVVRSEKEHVQYYPVSPSCKIGLRTPGSRHVF